MNTYHKIKSLYKRNPDDNYKTMLVGHFSVPEFGYLKDCDWIMTEKVDGTNMRAMWNLEKMDAAQGTFYFGGKTDKAQLHGGVIDFMQNIFNNAHTIDYMEDNFQGANVCFYGEGYGGKIQAATRTYGLIQRFICFDIWVNGIWLQRSDVEAICVKIDIPIVPVVAIENLTLMEIYCNQGFPSKWGDFEAEGLIAVPKVPLRDRRGNRIIAKLKCKDFK